MRQSAKAVLRRTRIREANFDPSGFLVRQNDCLILNTGNKFAGIKFFFTNFEKLSEVNKYRYGRDAPDIRLAG
jgi:hypothetical protein